MKTGLRFIFVIALASAMVLQSCKKEKKVTPETPVTPPTTEDQDIPLTPDQVAVLDSVPYIYKSLDEIFFPDGQSVRDFMEQNDPDFLQQFPSRRSGSSGLSPEFQKKLFLGRMVTQGTFLCDRPARKAAMDAPQQDNGLAYGWGSKKYSQREAPPGNGSGCHNPIYALDCSGMVYTLAYGSGLVKLQDLFPKNVANLSKVTNWDDGFKYSSSFTSLRMIDMGYVPPGDLKFGDIVCWSNHIGFLADNGLMYQSNGSDTASCASNMIASRGPRQIPLSEILVPKWGAGGLNYKVLRVADNATAIFTSAPGVFGDVKYFSVTDPPNGTEWPAALAGVDFLSPLGYYAIGFAPTDTFGNHRITMQINVPSTEVGTYTFGTLAQPNCYIFVSETGGTRWGSIYLTPDFKNFQPGSVTIDEKWVGGDGKTYLRGSYSGNTTFIDNNCTPVPCYIDGSVSGKFTAVVH